MSDAISSTPTGWAIRCRTHGLVFLTYAEYLAQLGAADYRWNCPECGENASWDDATHQKYLDMMEDASETSCPECGHAEVSAELKIEKIPFLHNSNEHQTEAVVPVMTCKKCNYGFTGHSAEVIRDGSVKIAREKLDGKANS